MTKRFLAALVVCGCIALPTSSSAQSAPTQTPPRTDILRLVSQTPVVAPDGDHTPDVVLSRAGQDAA